MLDKLRRFGPVAHTFFVRKETDEYNEYNKTVELLVGHPSELKGIEDNMIRLRDALDNKFIDKRTGIIKIEPSIKEQ